MTRKKVRSKHNIKVMINEHKFVLFAAITACIASIIAAGFVLYWFITTNNIIPQGLMTIDEVSMATLLWFAVNLFFWEALLVGLPASIVFGVGGYLWWNGLSKKNKNLCLRIKSARIKIMVVLVSYYSLLTLLTY